MGLIILGIFLCFFHKRIQEISNKEKMCAVILLGLLIVFSIILNRYLEAAFGWEYGIPGADMTAHYEGARAIADGTKLEDLGLVNSRFALRFSNIGYIVYAYFLAIVSFMPVIISVRVSLQIMYIIQAVVATCAIINITDFFAGNNKKARRSIILMLSFCICIAQMAAVLMRDIWILLFISLLMRECKKEKPRIWACVILLALNAVLRPYSLVIVVPIFVAYYLKKKKEAIIILIAICAVFFVGRTIVDSVAVYMHILWEYSYNFSWDRLYAFFFFPNIISQSANVQHMTTGYHAIHGGNSEWIYYLLACWNVYTMPIMGYGVVQCIRKKKFEETVLWGAMILAIALIYAVFYGSVSEPRHKLMLLYSYSFFYVEGSIKMKLKAKIIYFLAVTMLLLIVFLFVY